MSRRIEIESGYKVNRLTYIRESNDRLDSNGKKQRYIIVNCECGSDEFEIRFPAFFYGYTKSCGCLNKETMSKNMSTHKLANHKLYPKYRDMLNRCYNPSRDRYKNYGARGISVCEEWKNKENGFINFYNWSMEKGYEEGLTIDRIDNDKDYSPNNCQWLSMGDNTKKRFIDGAKYIIIGVSPNGEIFEFISRVEFAKEHNLNPDGITACLCGNSKTHNGWKFSKKNNVIKGEYNGK